MCPRVNYKRMFTAPPYSRSNMYSLVEVEHRLSFYLQHYCKSTKQLTQIHSFITSNGFGEKKPIFLKVLYLYTQLLSPQHAHKVFDKLDKPKETKLWNKIIKAHCLEGNPRKSVELFKDMGRSLAFPDAYSCNYIIDSCKKGGFFREGEQTHGRILKCGLCSNVHVGTSLVDFYVKCKGGNDIEKAWMVFDEMPEKNVIVWNSLIFGCFRLGDVDGARRVFQKMPEKSVVTWTTMISGFIKNGRCKEGLSLFCNMLENNAKFDEVTLLTMLTGCAELKNLSIGKWIHSYIDKSFIYKKQGAHFIKLYNALIHMYASCGEIFEAFAVFGGMEEKNIVSWSTMITGFAKQGYGNEALSVFKWMINVEGYKFQPDEIMLSGVLSACINSGRVNEGRYYFSNMIKIWGVEPNVEHFACMVDLFTRAGLLKEAHKLQKYMPLRWNDASRSWVYRYGVLTGFTEE